MHMKFLFMHKFDYKSFYALNSARKSAENVHLWPKPFVKSVVFLYYRDKYYRSKCT